VNIELAWENAAQSVLRMTFCPGWDWEDLYSALYQQEEWLTGINHPVHTIIDCSQAGALPDESDKFRRSFTGDGRKFRVGLTVLVGKGTLVRPILEVMTYIRNSKAGKQVCLLARSVDEAHSLLAVRGGAA
jgi:hypothetical protein